jgi:hypothetical protein
LDSVEAQLKFSSALFRRRFEFLSDSVWVLFRFVLGSFWIGIVLDLARVRIRICIWFEFGLNSFDFCLDSVEVHFGSSQIWVGLRLSWVCVRFVWFVSNCG